MYEGLYAPIPDVDAYLRRLAVQKEEVLDKRYLDTLIYAHQCQVVFENLDVYRAHRPISLKIEDIFQKVVRDGRGGYCFELNALFTQLLKDLGYEAYPCMSRIVRGKDFIPPVLHRGIIVRLGQELYFCDVGYGGPMPPGAVLIRDGYSAELYGEHFHMRRRDGYWWTLSRTTSSGEKEEILEFYTMPQENVDFIALNEYCSQNAESVFTQRCYINVRTSSGNKSILGDIFTVVENGCATAQTIESEERYDQILRSHFGLQI